MNGMQYGFLTTLSACDEALRNIGFQILDLNNALARVERNGTRTLTEDEQEWVEKRRAQLEKLKSDRNEIRDHKRRLNDQKDELFEASFKLAARELLDDVTYQKLVDRALEIEATNNERRAVSNTASFALGVRGNSGGMRTRRNG